MKARGVHRRSRALAAMAGVLAAALVSSDVPGVSAITTTVAERTNPWPPARGAGSRLVFSDTFVGPGLDRAKWTTCYPWARASGCTNASTKELEWYRPAGVSVSGHALHLTAQRQEVVEGGKRYGFTSGMVATAGAFQFTYAYVEFRARVPKGRGLWSALWLLPSTESWPPEIDVVEVLGGDPARALLTYHPPTGRQRQRTATTANLAAGWHDFAVDWRPGSIEWLIDSKPLYQDTGDVPNQPMYLLMDLAVSGTKPPDASTPFPASLDVQYVRVWQPG